VVEDEPSGESANKEFGILPKNEADPADDGDSGDRGYVFVGAGADAVVDFSYSADIKVVQRPMRQDSQRKGQPPSAFTSLLDRNSRKYMEFSPGHGYSLNPAVWSQIS